MTLPLLGVLGGLVVLVWSADRFVDGAAAAANHFAISPLLIGMVIVGFGTSAPEMVVSAIASSQGNPGLALGNAYGSNIANIGLILGLTALICPIAVHSQIIRKELPILLAVTALTAVLLFDNQLRRWDAFALLAVFAAVMGWSIYQSLRARGDAFATEMAEEIADKPETYVMPLSRAVLWIAVGLLLLIGSSRLMVWGAVEIAEGLGVSDLLIGLTIVAIGTSLPELASSIVAARKDEPDIALGNVIGSNLFNTLVVVGIAGSIAPMAVAAEILRRDVLIVALLSVALYFVCKGSNARITRTQGGLLIAAYLGYTAWLIFGALRG
jgi:cation:H+ antiporter